jgi:hypothetical protein
VTIKGTGAGSVDIKAAYSGNNFYWTSSGTHVLKIT